MQDNKIAIGKKVRVYDYPIMNTARPVYAEGEVTRLIDSPFSGFVILCERCTYYGREGQEIAVPFQREIAEFEGRIHVLTE